MKVLGLDNKQYVMNLVGYLDEGNDKSELHLSTRLLLKKIFPTFPILEEVFLPGCGGLYADFFLPKQKCVVECHGKQHYEYVYHFHRDYAGFAKSKKRDNDKREWCLLNKFYYVEIPYYEGKEQHERRIRNYYES